MRNANNDMSIKEVTEFLVKLALAEDVGPGDVTTRALVGTDRRAGGAVKVKENGVVCGLAVAAEVFRHLDRRVRFVPKVKDGASVKKGQVIAVVSGPARAILTGERTALNFLQHLSGIATLTHKFKSQKSKVKNKVTLLDTRKTIPGLRVLEKYAVRCGGGTNHRLGLHDAILIKDNHIKLAGGIKRAIDRVKGVGGRGKNIEIEARSLAQVKEAIALKVDRVLLDNMTLKNLRRAVKLCKKARIKTEASGGINLANVRAIARTGVDYISIGALTHSAPALDVNLKIV
jgi:nicotinate-nucleotide pyrophosphorylase (carboxylating)